jgi:hypothetical protein
MLENFLFNVNPDQKGFHEVHRENCSYLPAIENRKKIGRFSSCKLAILIAKLEYLTDKFDGCFYCCNECHKG